MMEPNQRNAGAVCVPALLEQLRGEVRETLSGFDQIGDEELYDCIDQQLPARRGGSICRWGSGLN